jgi:uncharacterized protein YecE (DUF72 family)
MAKGKIFIGTSGWNYKHWRGNFYPAGLKHAEEFKWYQQHFDTVELNNSFYHLPDAKTFSTWRRTTKPKFSFAVKASRFITHMKKLKVDKPSIRLFFSRADKLEKKLGPVLFQLPPRWKINVERFAAFLPALPKKHRYVFEFREPGWYNESIYGLLRKYNCAFCIYELAGHYSPEILTADFVYIRLHGPGNKYQGNYSDATLKLWATKISKWRKKGLDVFVYFDNDQNGYAAYNAIKLKELIESSNK